MSTRTPWIRHGLNEARRSLTLARRYWIEATLSLGFVASLFGGLVFAVLKASGQSLDSGQADGLIIGFALWMFASGLAHGSAKEIVEETQQRTLEQLQLAPMSLGQLLAVRLLLESMMGLALLVLTLGLIAWLTDGRVQLSLPALGLAVLGAPAMAGLGYALAGLSLLVKRGELLMMAAYPLVIGLVSLPALPLSGLSALPYSLAAAAALATAGGQAVPAEVWAWVALGSAVFLSLGVAVFRRCLRQARHLGVLGHI